MSDGVAAESELLRELEEAASASVQPPARITGYQILVSGDEDVRVQVIGWKHMPDQEPGAAEAVTLKEHNLPEKQAALLVYRYQRALHGRESPGRGVKVVFATRSET
jgi:hypothetical protein